MKQFSLFVRVIPIGGVYVSSRFPPGLFIYHSFPPPSGGLFAIFAYLWLFPIKTPKYSPAKMRPKIRLRFTGINRQTHKQSRSNGKAVPIERST